MSKNTLIHSGKEEFNEQSIQLKIKGTIFYPIGIAFEMMEDLAGSNYFVYYRPIEENKSRVIVVGEFKSCFSNTSEEDKEKITFLTIIALIANI